MLRLDRPPAEPLAAAAGPSLQLSTPDDPEPLWLDGSSTEIEQAILNLVMNARDAKGITPLVSAVNANFAEGVELLLGKGARLDDSNNAGETPLITAVHNRNVPVLRLLLKAGADPDRADNSGRSAKDYARLAGGSLLSEIEANAKPKGGGKAKSYGPKF